MNLKPLRNLSEYEVINFFALDAASGDKGSLVVIKGDGFVSTANLTWQQNEGTPAHNVVNPRWSVPSQVALATSGASKTTVLGVMLYDVRDSSYLGRPSQWDRQRMAEKQAVASGEAVPVMVRGYILVSGYEGTAGANSGIVAADAGNGAWKVVAAGTANSIGKFLGKADADGYALAYINTI